MIDVVGVSARGWDSLAEPERRLVLEAQVLLGGRRHLQMVPAVDGQERLAWPSPLRPALPDLVTNLSGRRTVVIATGDPLLSGIGTTLIDLLGTADVRVHPAVSSAALARARLGWSAEESVTVSVVGRDLNRLRRDLSPQARLIVLSGGPVTPAEVARLLVAEGYGPSPVTVLADLDTDTEAHWEKTASEWVQQPHADIPALHLLAVDCRLAPGWHARSLVPGLPDETYENDGQLTKRDVRASALAHLEPLPGQLLWDVGAGAGSIAVEWCRQHPRNRATALERRADRAERIQRNAVALGVSAQLQVVPGDATDLVDTLEAPHAVFVGGGTDEELLHRCWQALRPGGRIVVHCVTVQTEQVVLDARGRFGGQVSRLSVEHLEPIGSYHGWRPARAVTQWTARKPNGARPHSESLDIQVEAADSTPAGPVH